MIEKVRSFVLFCFFHISTFFKNPLMTLTDHKMSFPYTEPVNHAEMTVIYITYFMLQFSRSVMSDSLRPHGLQHARPPCPSPTPRAYSNSSPLSRWCHPTISSSVIPFSSCLQSFPALGSFPVSQFFTSGGQTIGVSASASVLPMNIQNWFPLELADLVSLQSKGLSRVFSSTTVQKHQFFTTQPSLYFIFLFYGREWKLELRSIEEKRTKDHRENLNERGNLKFSVAEDIGVSFQWVME